MSIRIGIANYAGFVQFIERLRPEIPKDVEFFILNDLLSELERSVKRIEAAGSVDIFVASGGNAEYLEKYLKSIPLVKVKITGFDILSAVKEARSFSDHIAIVTMHELPQFEAVQDLLNVDLRHVIYNTPEDLTAILSSLHAEGIRDIIGTALVLDQAKMFDMRGHFIWSLDSVRTAIETAIAMARTKKEIAGKAKTLDYLMDYAAEGIIITDRNGIITDFNNSAERILNRSKKRAIGHSCEEILPNTQLFTVMREKRAQYNKIQDLGNVKIVTNRSPIICENEVIGALATFFSTGTIKQAGENIRRSQDYIRPIAPVRLEDIHTVNSDMAELKETAEQYARSCFPVLLLGEEGTGKTAVAQAIHNSSSRRNEAFIAVNCAAIHDSILDALMFGTEGMSYGSEKRNGTRGLLEQAHEGTLFLQEVDCLPIYMQKKLLAVLDEKTLRRVNGERLIPCDFRVLASSSRNLHALMQRGEFCRELYYSLSVLCLRLPSLKERRDDVPVLIQEIVANNFGNLKPGELNAICNCSLFVDYDWPGNIRELKNVVERFCVLYKSGMDVDKTAHAALNYGMLSGERNVTETERERQEIEEALRLADGNRAKAAEILGISRTTLWRRMQENSD